MKLVKFVPALLAASVLAACSTANEAASNAAEAVTESAANVVNSAEQALQTSVEKVATTSKSVAYQCLNKVKVSATYAFEGDKPRAVNLQVGKQLIKGLAYDSSNKDQATFKSDKYRWNLDNEFYQDITKAGGMLTQVDGEVHPILAKLCEVDKRATKRLNP